MWWLIWWWGWGVDMIKRCIKVECTSLLGVLVSVFPESEPTEWKRTVWTRLGPGRNSNPL